jgi:hypothetical protein
MVVDIHGRLLLPELTDSASHRTDVANFLKLDELAVV